MDINYYKEQLQAKEDMLSRTTEYLKRSQESLLEKNRYLSSVQQDIFNSVNFAKVIQTSLLPDINILKIFFSDAVYRVCQQIGIGGDTIFIKSTNNGVAFGLLDATGHGIPASMLSISGSMILNDVTSSIEIDDPGVLLKLLNYRLHKTFNDGRHSIAHFEGIVFYYSVRDNRLLYSSAKGKGLLRKMNGEILTLRNSKNSVGENPNVEFETFELPVQNGDKLLIFSDGLTDQFGGERDKKYTSSRLKQLLCETGTEPVDQLSEAIFQQHISWRGSHEQTDDLSYKLIEF
jgi:serine phosphatase RsbU (regulator of sigma subunit)